MEDTKAIVLVLVDFFNTFNTVIREVLISILTYIILRLPQTHHNGSPHIFKDVSSVFVFKTPLRGGATSAVALLKAIFYLTYCSLHINCIRFTFNLRSSYLNDNPFVYVVIIERCPPFLFLNSLFSFTCFDHVLCYFSSIHDRNFRSTNNLLLLCPFQNSDFVNAKSFAVLLWNEKLPLESRMSTNHYTF